MEVALAADESITGLTDLRALAATGALDVVVLKAQRLGGPTALLELAREARRLGAAVVVTDSIETSVGRALAAHAAAALEGEPLPVGLGGAMLMQGDPLGTAVVEAARVRAAGPGLGI
jgi:O-succinylbenzoate synthase